MQAGEVYPEHGPASTHRPPPKAMPLVPNPVSGPANVTDVGDTFALTLTGPDVDTLPLASFSSTTGCLPSVEPEALLDDGLTLRFSCDTVPGFTVKEADVPVRVGTLEVAVIACEPDADRLSECELRTPDEKALVVAPVRTLPEVVLRVVVAVKLVTVLP
jgi:hypothetical protein